MVIMHKPNKIHITNDRLWEIAQAGDDIDEWLRNNIGFGKYHEWIGFINLPHRSFSFDDEKDAILFSLRWL